MLQLHQRERAVSVCVQARLVVGSVSNRLFVTKTLTVNEQQHGHGERQTLGGVKNAVTVHLWFEEVDRRSIC